MSSVHTDRGVWWLAWLLNVAFACFLVAEEPGRIEIRPFLPEVIERLGSELYQRDQLAWKATDALRDQFPESKSLRIKGWITQLGTPISQVYFIVQATEQKGYELAYLVEFEKGAEPRVIARLGEPLPEEVARRFQARATAIKAMPGFYERNYNIEVLDDPDGEGFLVCVMVATQEAHEMVVGGHVRITVSADGERAEQVDELSRSLLILDKREKDSQNVIATMVSHVVSSTPVETHVFNSLLHGQALYVVTGPDELWGVENGKISRSAGFTTPKPTAP